MGQDKDLNHSAGDLLPGAYQQLRRLAAGMLAAHMADPVIQPTALVHEVYLGMSARSRARYRDKEHFIATASIQLRRALLDHARHIRAGKRDLRLRVTMTDTLPGERDTHVELLDLCAAMEELDSHHPRQCNTFALRFFGGMSVKECAQQLGVSTGTIKSDWKFAGAWLARRLSGPEAGGAT